MSWSAARSWLDLLGLILLAAILGWTSLVGAWPGFSTGSFTALLSATAAALLLARLAVTMRWLVPTATAAAAALVAVTTEDLLSGTSLGGPLGYANANGAFFVQAAMAGLMMTAACRTYAMKLVGLVSAVCFAVVPFAAKSVTSAALLVVLPVVALSIRPVVGERAVIAGCAALFLLTFSATAVLGSTYAAGNRSGSVERLVDSTLTERRVALWSEALVLMGQRPVSGVGRGGFQALSATARSDRDARWAHNSFLQHGAETGLIGLVLLVLLFLWGFASLGTSESPDTMTVLGAVALAALGIHACVDYILHFPAVPITAAALVGAAAINKREMGRTRPKTPMKMQDPIRELQE